MGKYDGCEYKGYTGFSGTNNDSEKDTEKSSVDYWSTSEADYRQSTRVGKDGDVNVYTQKRMKK